MKEKRERGRERERWVGADGLGLRVRETTSTRRGTGKKTGRRFAADEVERVKAAGA